MHEATTTPTNAMDALHDEVRELDSRVQEGLEVTLFWDPGANRVFVVVADACADEWFRVDVDAADALDAFRHPYAYGQDASGWPPA